MRRKRLASHGVHQGPHSPLLHSGRSIFSFQRTYNLYTISSLEPKHMLPVVNIEKSRSLWPCVLVVEAAGSRLEIVNLTRVVGGRIARVS